MLSWTKRPDSKKENQSKPLEEKIKWSRMNDAKARFCGEFYAEWMNDAHVRVRFKFNYFKLAWSLLMFQDTILM